MNFNFKRIFFSLGILSLLISSCSQKTRRFKGGGGSILSELSDTTQKITCREESASDKNFTFPRAPKNYTLVFEKTCQKQGVESVRKNTAIPINIIFVIDITKSMQDSLNYLKEYSIDLGKSLKNRGFDFSLAAIGFADRRSEFKVVDFGDEINFQRSVGAWELVDGEDEQENGQEAISQALTKLFNKNSSNENMNNVIFYISDAPFYSLARSGMLADHNDFSIDRLVNKFYFSSKPKVPNLSFYYSVPLDQKKGSNLPNPKVQIDKLYEKVKAPGIKEIKMLAYPLSEEILNIFKSDSVDVSTRNKGICELKALTFESIDGAKNPYSISYDKSNIELFKQGVTFKPTDPNQDNYIVKLERCCKKVGEDECSSYDNVNFTFRYRVKKGSF